MRLRTLWAQYLFLGIFLPVMFGQQNAPVSAQAPEFPVVMLQSVAAGKTPVGTEVRAKLQVATLVNRTVIPRNAVFFGEVIQSEKKTTNDPSRLSIRMDSVQWKNGSVAIKVYVTAWYYLTMAEAGQNLQYGPPQSPTRTWNGQGAYPNPNSGSYKPFPGGDQDSDKNSVPDTASSRTSDHRVLMKDVDSLQLNDGTLALVSRRTNIKLDKLTTYVLSAGDLLPKK